MIRILTLNGTYKEIGRQHGEQITELRPLILKSITTRLESLRPYENEIPPLVEEMAETWAQHAPETLEILNGIAETMNLEWNDYFKYTISSYLGDRLRLMRQAEGCTTWAASGTITGDSAPILSKNRDYRPDHQPLQCLARIRTRDGYPYLCLTSAGSPGVFSSGINSAGLAVADTYVGSKDVGPGVARYSFMMYLLERFSSVQQAIDYLPTVPHSGSGTMTLVDSQGEIAVFEVTHTFQVVRRSMDGFIASTNHFTAPETCSLWIDGESEHLRGNSQARREKVESALRSTIGNIDVLFSQRLMAYHGDNLSSLCRHSDIEPGSITISNVILLPLQVGMYVTSAQPCNSPFEFVKVIN